MLKWYSVIIETFISIVFQSNSMKTNVNCKLNIVLKMVIIIDTGK